MARRKTTTRRTKRKKGVAHAVGRLKTLRGHIKTKRALSRKRRQ